MNRKFLTFIFRIWLSNDSEIPSALLLQRRLFPVPFRAGQVAANGESVEIGRRTFISRVRRLKGYFLGASSETTRERKLVRGEIRR